jgi:hypothetical protein
MGTPTPEANIVPLPEFHQTMKKVFFSFELLLHLRARKHFMIAQFD